MERRHIHVSCLVMGVVVALGFGLAAAGKDGGLYIPDSKKENESLDTAAAKGHFDDRLFLVNSDRITGKVIEMTAEGVVRVLNPLFHEPLLVRLSSVERAEMSSLGRILDGPDVIILSDGNQIRGAVESITDKVVTLRSKALGKANLHRSSIGVIWFNIARQVLLNSEFDKDTAKPWIKKGGNWKVRNDKYHCLSAEGWTMAKLHQDGNVTVEWIASGMNDAQYTTVTFFASGDFNHLGGNALGLKFRKDHVSLFQTVNWKPKNLADKKLKDGKQRATYAIQYDPGASKVSLRINGADYGTYSVSPPMKSGSLIHIYCEGPVSFESFSVIRDARTMENTMTSGKKGRDTIVMTNRDQAAGKFIKLSKNGAAIKTTYGVLDIPRNRLLRLSLRSDERVRPKRRKGDCRLTFYDGSILVGRFKDVNQRDININSELFMDGGDAKVNRKGVKEIQFEIHRGKK